MTKRVAPEFSRRCGPFVVLICALSVLADCGGPALTRNQVLLTVQTEPQGAMLYSNGAAVGMAPQTRVFTADAQAQATGWIRTANVTAIWPSGAKTEISLTLVLHQGPQVVTITRPPDAPGLDVDMANAAKLQQAKTPQDEAQAQAHHDTQQRTTPQTDDNTHKR
jgi:hypothetical protein